MSGEPAAKAQAKDWHSSKHISKRARYLLEHPDAEIPSDVTFLVGDGQNEQQRMFKCHKFILAMVSSMFQAMFYGSFPETEGIVKIPDVSPAAFQNMLRYAYGGNVELDGKSADSALDTLYCAKKYLIAKLERACRDHIQLNTITYNYKDPCVVFQKALQIDEDDLAGLALARIALKPAVVMKKAAFPRLSFSCVKRIVDYAHLNATEAEVYQGVRRWITLNVGAVTGNALRDAFGSLLYSIRFPLFSAAELVIGPVMDGVLTGDEVNQIFQFFYADIKPALPFLTTPRSRPAASFSCYFTLVTAPAGAVIRGFLQHPLLLLSRPDLAPACCAFLRQLVEGKFHIRIASYDNEHLGKTVPLPAAVAEEQNVLSFSFKGACWFEWDVEGGAACNVRIVAARRPGLYHSAVFGLVLGLIGQKQSAPFDLWDDKCIQGVEKFRVG